MNVNMRRYMQMRQPVYFNRENTVAPHASGYPCNQSKTFWLIISSQKTVSRPRRHHGKNVGSLRIKTQGSNALDTLAKARFLVL